MTKITRKIAAKVLETVDAGLSKGVGVREPGSMCVEAAACYALGLPHGDDPGCVSAPLRQLKMNLNDRDWSSKEARAKGLRRLALAPARLPHTGITNVTATGRTGASGSPRPMTTPQPRSSRPRRRLPKQRLAWRPEH
jgi:hypothetical protein